MMLQGARAVEAVHRAGCQLEEFVNCANGKGGARDECKLVGQRSLHPPVCELRGCGQEVAAIEAPADLIDHAHPVAHPQKRRDQFGREAPVAVHMLLSKEAGDQQVQQHFGNGS